MFFKRLLELVIILHGIILIVMYFASSGARANKALFKTNVVDLDSGNFDSIAMDKTKDVLVEFYAPCKIHKYLFSANLCLKSILKTSDFREIALICNLMERKRKKN